MWAQGSPVTLVEVAVPPVRRAPDASLSSRPGPAAHRSPGVESNARLTGTVAAVLLVLLPAEGVTVLRVRALLTAHVFIGMLLVPPVLLKIGTTGYRFVRYYAGSPAYRRKGPPPLLLRVLGPLVVVLTTCLFASGIALLFVGHGLPVTCSCSTRRASCCGSGPWPSMSWAISWTRPASLRRISTGAPAGRSKERVPASGP